MLTQYHNTLSPPTPTPPPSEKKGIMVIVIDILQHHRLHQMQQHQQLMMQQLKKNQLRSQRRAKEFSGLLMTQTWLYSTSLRWMKMKEVGLRCLPYIYFVSEKTGVFVMNSLFLSCGVQLFDCQFV